MHHSVVFLIMGVLVSLGRSTQPVDSYRCLEETATLTLNFASSLYSFIIDDNCVHTLIHCISGAS